MPDEEHVELAEAEEGGTAAREQTSAVAVLIAGADASTRAGVRISLTQGGFEICGEAADRPAAVELALREQPDLCVLDAEMPGGGIAAAAEIGDQVPGTRIVMLTASLSEEILFAALRAGAVGYLPKEIDPERLAPALHGVLNGEAAVPRTLVARVIEEFRGWERRRIPRLAGIDPGLTDREWEVLLLLRERLRTAEMAERLKISPVTVRRHVSEVLRKLGVADRGAAVRLLAEGRARTGDARPGGGTGRRGSG